MFLSDLAEIIQMILAKYGDMPIAEEDYELGTLNDIVSLRIEDIDGLDVLVLSNKPIEEKNIKSYKN